MCFDSISPVNTSASKDFDGAPDRYKQEGCAETGLSKERCPQAAESLDAGD